MNKKKLILLIIFVLLIVVIAGVYSVHTSHIAISSNYSIYGQYFGTVLKDDRVIAKVNGEPVYLSEVAIPFFSSNVSYIGAKETIQSALNDPNVSESTKQNIRNLKPMTPTKTLDWLIGMTLLKQQIAKEGMMVSDDSVMEEIKNLEVLDKKNMDNNPENELVKYRREALKILGITNEQYYERYYIKLLRVTDIVDKYRAVIQTSEPTEDQIKEKMDKDILSRESAIDRIKGEQIQSILDKKIEGLRKNANIEIVDIKAVEDLCKYFEN